MKKGLIALVIILVIVFGGILFLKNVNINRLGTDEYYTEIIGEGNKTESKASGGQVYASYEYELPAYDKEGNEKTFTFTATKQLRENAYLLLYVRDSKGVTSYQEVQLDEIPEKAANRLK